MTEPELCRKYEETQALSFALGLSVVQSHGMTFAIQKDNKEIASFRTLAEVNAYLAGWVKL